MKREGIEPQNLTEAAKFFLLHSYKDAWRRKLHFMIAFCSVFLVVCSTLIINQIISKGNIIFLKISESTHGEIDAVVTPSADIMARTLDGIEYESPALLNLTAVQHHYNLTEHSLRDELLLSPRKIFPSTKVVKESKAGIYNDSSTIQMERWHSTFDPKYNLPLRRDAYGIKFANNLDDYAIVTFKTERERSIELGRKYHYPELDVG
jgi:hypothetical protein